MKKHHIYGLGNALVDIEVEVSEEFLKKEGLEKGLMILVDEQKQTDLLNACHGLTHRRSCGGSAANTIIAARQLGARTFYSCKVAADEMGDFYFQDLLEQGVETNLSSQRPQGHSGRCLVFVTPDADRTMYTSLGISVELGENEIDEKELIDSEYLYLEGYTVTSDSARQASIKAREIAQKNGVKTALTFSDPGVVTHFKSGFQEMIGRGIDLLFCNEAEALSFTGEATIEAAFESLKEVAQSFAITRGPLGAMIFDGQKEIHVLAPRVKAVDTNGAGDLFAGGVLYGLSQGRSFAESGRLACELSSCLVTQFGARLPAATTQKIKTEVLS